MWFGGQGVSDQEGPGTVHGPLGRELVTLAVSKHYYIVAQNYVLALGTRMCHKVEHAMGNKGVCHLGKKILIDKN